jgi:hypothetical protein
MNEKSPDANAKKVKYIASIIYLLVFTFIVVGSYINQQPSVEQQGIDKEPRKQGTL